MKKLVSYLFLFFMAVPLLAGTNHQMEPIVITAAKDDSLVRDYPGNVDVITRESIEQMAVKDVPDLLRSITGLQVYKRTDHDYVIDSRGFNNGAGNGQRIILLINGMPAMNGDSGSLDWTLVSLNDIERVEVIKGSTGSVYGNGAAAGVINIITLGRKKVSSSGFRMGYGSYNTVHGSFNVDEVTGKGRVGVKLDYRTSDGYRKNSNYEDRNVKLDLSRVLNPETEVEGHFSYGKAEYVFPGAITHDDREKYSERDSSTPAFSQNYDIFLFQTKLKHDYTPDTKMNLSVGFKDRSYDYSSGVNYDNRLYSMELQFSHRFSWRIFNNKSFAGLALQKELIYNPYVDTTGKVSAGYVKNNLVVLKKVHVDLGYRYDLLENIYKGDISRLKKFYRMDSYNIGVLGKFYKENNVYASYAQAFRIPVRDEIVRYEYNWMTYQVTNISLSMVKPERARNFETGMNLFPFRNIQVSANLFYMQVRDEIFLVNNANTNIREVVHKGLESKLDIRVIKQVRLSAGHTFQKIYFSRSDFTNKIVPLTPENIFSAEFSLLPFKGLVISHMTRYRDKVYVANDMKNERTKLKDYAISDLKVAYQNRLGRIEFSIFNLYNEWYSDYAGINWKGDIGYYPALRRNYELSMSLYF
ncbi:MAG: TonB-dependent receptor [bacterium]|nr:TonB-dependent receptor [bacterium]